MDIIIHNNLYEELVYNIEKINMQDSLSISFSKNIKIDSSRKYLFFLNPIGGSGKSVIIWKSIQPILR